MDPLHDHGDRQVPAGTLDLAVNVLGPTPGWLLDELRGRRPGRLPRPGDPRSPRSRRGTATAPGRCLVLHGAAEAFTLVAQALRPRLAACVHPSFTAPEAALRAAGVPVHRVLRDPAHDFALDPAAVPEEADLVVLGRPDNPTGRLDPVEAVAALARPGRVLVVDEAFADFLPDAHGLHGAGIPGLLCVRSLTKLWGIAGLRVGYLLGAGRPWSRGWRRSGSRGRSARPRSGRPPCSPAPRRSGGSGRSGWPTTAPRCWSELAPLPLTVWPSPANFLLLRSPRPDLRDRLLEHGVAVRRGETFPGLDAHHVRVAVHPDPEVRSALVAALRRVLPAGDADVRRPGPRRRRRGRAPDAGARRRPLRQVPARAAAAGRPARRPVRRPGAGARRQRRRLGGPGGRATSRTGPPPGPPARPPTSPAALESARTGRCWSTAWPPGSRRRWRTPGPGSPPTATPPGSRRLDDEVDRLVRAWRSVRVPVVAVSNEVGSGVVPGTRSGVLFRDALGRLNRRLADASDDVRLVVAGRVQRLEGDPQ